MRIIIYILTCLSSSILYSQINRPIGINSTLDQDLIERLNSQIQSGVYSLDTINLYKLMKAKIYYSRLEKYSETIEICNELYSQDSTQYDALWLLELAHIKLAGQIKKGEYTSLDIAILVSKSIEYLKAIPKMHSRFNDAQKKIEKYNKYLLTKQELVEHLSANCDQRADNIYCYLGYGLDREVQMKYKTK